MKYITIVITYLFFSWPALVLGYLFAAIRSGWAVGVHLQDVHEDAAIEKFIRSKT
jgi:hypothetical protein